VDLTVEQERDGQDKKKHAGAVADREILKGGGEDNVLALSPFIANTHTTNNMPFIRKKDGLLKKI